MVTGVGGVDRRFPYLAGEARFPYLAGEARFTYLAGEARFPYLAGEARFPELGPQALPVRCRWAFQGMHDQRGRRGVVH